MLNNSDKRISDIKTYKFYGIILADIWLETKTKKEIFNEYKDKTFIKNKYPSFELKELYYDIREFNNIIDNYKLLSFLWKLD